ncbi:MAG: hypothetical protein M1815_002338 [Lichina confinis]|nr:MAG: hypothetical protein M1815_002338 [Lichina confinis]
MDPVPPALPTAKRRLMEIAEAPQHRQAEPKRLKIEHGGVNFEIADASASEHAGQDEQILEDYDDGLTINTPVDSIESPRYAAAQGSARDAIAEGVRGRESGLSDSAYGIDFRSAPSDPIELALWVAQQISHLQQPRRDSASDPDEQSSAAPSQSQSPEATQANEDPAMVMERERQRFENRERKKRWRESNAVRNKDNDLRCRINRRAKQLWGSQHSADRYAWMEAEFNKRRAKRESKGRGRPAEEGLDTSGQHSDLRDVLFTGTATETQGETNAAGILLTNALLGPGQNGSGPDPKAARALKSAIQTGTFDTRPFTEALKAMAANADIMGGINALLDQSPRLADQETAIAFEDQPVHGPTEATEAAEEDADQSVSEAVDECTAEESAIVRALNAATAMLNQMNAASQNHNDPAQSGVRPSESGRGPDDAAAIQADQVATRQEGATGVGSVDHEAQHDANICGTLETIVQHVLGQQIGQETGSAAEGWTSTAEADTLLPLEMPPSSSAASAPASAFVPRESSHAIASPSESLLQTILAYTRLPMNTVISTAEAQAMSQLLTHLAGQHHQSEPNADDGSIIGIGMPNTTQGQPYAGFGAAPDGSPAGLHAPSDMHSTGTLAQLNSMPNVVQALEEVLGLAQSVAPQPKPKTKEALEQELKAKSFGFPPRPVVKRK